MSEPDLHLEALHERERHGELEPAERIELSAHRRECGACALHAKAHELFAPQLVEQEGDTSKDLAAVTRAMAITAEGPVRRRAGRASWAFRIALAALVVGGVATAARRIRFDSGAAQGPSGLSAAASQPYRGREMLPPRVAQSGLDALADPPPAQADSVLAPKVQDPKNLPAVTPEELFLRANRARRQARDDQAMVLYRELQRRFPMSREARLSQATLARLLLEHGQAEQALSGFDNYLHSADQGPVTEDALVGRAMALEKLHKLEEERATWRELLARFPDSIHASRARARLGGSP